MKKGLAFRIHKGEKAGKTESEEETREEVQRVFFIFCLRHYRERIVQLEREVFLFVKSRERTERGVQLCELVFILEEKGWGAVGLRGFLFFLVYVSIICPDLINDKKMFLVDYPFFSSFQHDLTDVVYLLGMMFIYVGMGQ